MAISKKENKTQQSSPPKQLLSGLSDNQKWTYGFITFCIGLFALVAVCSYFFSWQIDFDIVRSGHLYGKGSLPVDNAMGRAGAWVGDKIVGQWFGFFGVIIPLTVILLSVRIMRKSTVYLRRSIRISIILMIVGSLYMGLFFDTQWNIFGSGLGGGHGVFVSDWLKDILGWMGEFLLLFCATVLLGVYITRSTIEVMNKVGKGLVDGGVKVGGAAVQQTTSLVGRIARKDDSRQNASIEEQQQDYTEDINPAPEREQPKQEQPEIVVVKASDNEGEVVQAAFHPTAGMSKSGDFEIVYKANTQPAIIDVLPEGIENNDCPFDVDSLSEAQEWGQERMDGPFEIIDRSDSGVLGAGGEVSGSEVLVSSRKDVTLQDEQIESSLYDPTLELSKYQRPPVEILEDHSIEVEVTTDEVRENNDRIRDTLKNFGIEIVPPVKATIGPTVTLYEIIPAPGVRIAKIKNLEDDIALSLSALGIRIIAPIPGKGSIGIEVPNKEKAVVSMYSVVRSLKFQDSKFDLPIVLGKTIQSETFVVDLAKMPHLLVAGATGQGKSVGLNAIITSLLYKKHPAELKFVLIDPKKVELTLYTKLEKHFLAKIPGEDDAIITDTQKVIYTLNSLCIEMDTRYTLLRNAEVRHIKEYNVKFVNRRLNPQKGHRYLPYIVVVIDEFADMIMTAGREIETPIARIAQLARAVGIHLVIATQRPTTNIITGVIKANFPARIAFRVSSMIDSRTIIDMPGANQLIGRGDMLISTGSDLTRVQCAFIDTPKIERIAEFIGNQRGYTSAFELPEYVPEGDKNSSKSVDMDKLDPMFKEIARYIVQHQQGSTSTVQRNFNIGFNRAGRIMDQLAAAGVVGRVDGSKPREVLISDMGSLEMLLGNM